MWIGRPAMPILAPSRSSVLRPLALALQPMAALALFASVACTNPGPKYPDVTSFCNGVATAQCNSKVLMACALPNPSTCIANYESICLSAPPAGLQPPGTTYNAAAGEGCVNAYAGAYADAVLTLTEMANITAACLEVFEGAGIVNASCVVDSDCKVGTGLRCVTSSAGTSTCQIPQAVAGGGSCSAPNQQCLIGYHCGATAHCDIDGAVNDPCSTTLPCGPGLTCSSASSTCLSKSADGSPCMGDIECVNGFCSIPQGQTTGICASEVIIAVNEPFCMAAR
jgi:hypothetical protein